MQINTAIDVLNSETPSFAWIINKYGNDGLIIAQATLNILVNDLVDFFNIGKTMGVPQVAQTVNLILEDFKQLKPEDFQLCFRRAKKSYYGKVYDRIDGQVIIGWLNQYEFEKSDEIEFYRQNEGARHKKAANAPVLLIPEVSVEVEKVDENTPIPMPDWFKAKTEEMFNKLKKPAPAAKVNPVNEMHQTWIKRFQEIWQAKTMKDILKGKTVPNGVCFIKRYGRHMDINEYLAYKQDQYFRIRERI